MSSTARYAVFGHPISHSQSPRIHQRFAEATHQDLTYEAQDVPPEDFDRALARFLADGGLGLNCTVPLKELAFARADELTPRAERAGAVNTLMRLPEGGLIGDNTDGVGLLRDLEENLKLPIQGERLLILGAGGAVRGILEPLLLAAPAALTLTNRTLEKAERLRDRFKSLGSIEVSDEAALEGQSFTLIINATSASLSGALPSLPRGLLAPGGTCYDLAYAKGEKTAFVRWGETQGARISADGIGMLVEQAAEAFWLWRGIRPSTGPVIRMLTADAGR